MTPEGEATQNVRLGASSLGMRLMRNNNGALKDITGRLVRYGLGNEKKNDLKELAFGDLVGGTKIKITPEMVGKEVLVFTMFEVKPPGKMSSSYNRAIKHEKSREAAQLRAINFIRNLGGLAWFASCAEDVKMVYDQYIKGLMK